MPGRYQDADGIEPVSDSFGETATNIAQYATVNGCGVTYSGLNMTFDVAAGVILHNRLFIPVAAQSAAGPLVADPTNPRWTWIALDNTGTVVVVSGTPAASPTVPEIGDYVAIALVKVEAAQTIANNITTKLDKGAVYPSAITKYKSATQVYTTSTSLTNVTATNGDFAFYAAASEVWMATYYIPLSFGGTGGFKCQIAGPATPTNVDITGEVNTAVLSTEGTSNVAAMHPIVPVTAFATNIVASDGNAAPGAGTFDSDLAGLVRIHLRLINGATAGIVTLQAAQNSSNSTTTLGLGSLMTAKRIA